MNRVTSPTPIVTPPTAKSFRELVRRPTHLVTKARSFDWPNHYPPLKPGTWFDAYPDPPGVDIFRRFRQIRDSFSGSCNKIKLISIIDTPALSFLNSPDGFRDANFLIRLSQSPGCDCEKSSLSVGAVQILKKVDGRVGSRYISTMDKMEYLRQTQEISTNNHRSKSWLFQTSSFRLSTLFLVITTCGLGLLLFTVSKELRKAKTENKYLSDQLGLLPDYFERELVCRRLTCNTPNHWSYQLFVPMPSRSTLICCDASGKKTQHRVWYAGYYRLDVALFKANDSKWYLDATLRGGNFGDRMSGEPQRNFRWQVEAEPGFYVSSKWTPETGMSEFRENSAHPAPQEFQSKIPLIDTKSANFGDKTIRLKLWLAVEAE